MEDRIKAYDIDGTIREKSGIPPEVIVGFQRLWREHILTTFLTARGFDRLQSALGEHIDDMWSPTIAAGLEGGGRVATRDGQHVTYYPLQGDQIERSMHMMHELAFNHVFYYPQDIRARPVMWSPDPVKLLQLQEDSSSFADVPGIDPHDFIKVMLEHKPCMISLAPIIQPSEMVLNRLHGVSNEGWVNVTAPGINKATGLVDISQHAGVPLSRISFTGNDENDIPAFLLDLEERILVGNNIKVLASIPHPFTHVQNPAELGNHL